MKKPLATLAIHTKAGSNTEAGMANVEAMRPPQIMSRTGQNAVKRGVLMLSCLVTPRRRRNWRAKKIKLPNPILMTAAWPRQLSSTCVMEVVVLVMRQPWLTGL